MAIQKRWSHYTKENAKDESDAHGVYEIGNRTTGKVLYIGEGHVKTRLFAHFADGAEPVVGADGYRIFMTYSKEECKSLQDYYLLKFKLKYKRLPKYNQKSKY